MKKTRKLIIIALIALFVSFILISKGNKLYASNYNDLTKVESISDVHLNNNGGANNGLLAEQIDLAIDELDAFLLTLDNPSQDVIDIIESAKVALTNVSDESEIDPIVTQAKTNAQNKYDEQIEYTITYILYTDYPNDPITFDPLVVTYTKLDTVNLAIPADRDSAVFAGWYEDFDEQPVTKIEVGSTGNKVFYAKWDKRVYEVSFIVDGLAYVPSIQVEHGSPINEVDFPVDPTKENLNFIGWRDIDDVYYNDQIPITEDTILFGIFHFASIYTITFNSNGGTLPTIASKQVVQNELYGLLATTTREGHVFAGWFTEQEGGEEVKANSIVLINANQTLYAQWIPNKYTVTFEDYDGTVLDTQLIDYGQDAVAPTPPVREDFIFVGWNKDYTNIKADLVVRAIYQSDYKFIVSFEVDGQIYEAQIVDENDLAIKPIDPTKEGHTFVNWYLDNNLFDFATPITTNLTIEAKWEVNTYSITYLVDEVEYQVLSYYYGTPISLLAEPTKAGYTFSGWTPSELPLKMPAVNIVVEGNFLINKYTVTFIDYDDTILDTQLVEHGSNALQPAIPDNKEGYHFVNWDKDYTNITSDLEVTAVYEINVYTVTFKDFDEVVLKVEEVEHNKFATAPTEPTREGYIFIGWDKDFTSVVEDLVVVALYEVEEITYTVTFKVDETIYETIDVVEDQLVVKPVDPTKVGHEFLGWYIEDIKFDFNTPITKAITLLAKWESLIDNAKDDFVNALEEFIEDVSEPTDYLEALINSLAEEINETNYENIEDLIADAIEQLLEEERTYGIDQLNNYLDELDEPSDLILSVIAEYEDLIDDEEDISKIKGLVEEALNCFEVTEMYEELTDKYDHYIKDEDQLYDEAGINELKDIYNTYKDKYLNKTITKAQLLVGLEELDNVLVKYTNNKIRPNQNDDKELKENEAYGLGISEKGLAKGTVLVVEIVLNIVNDNKIYEFIKNKQLIDKSGELTSKQLKKLLSKQEVYGQLNIYLADENGNKLENADLISGDKIEVKLLLPEELTNREDIKILYLTLDKVEVFEVTDEEKWLSFTTDHFSTFYLMGNPVKQVKNLWWVLIMVLVIVIAALTFIIIKEKKLRDKTEQLEANSIVLPFLAAALSPTALVIVIILIIIISLELAYLIYLRIFTMKKTLALKEEKEEEPKEFNFAAQETKTKELMTIYNYSYESRLFLADLETKQKYSQIKNHLFSYEGVTSKMTWREEKFLVNKKTILNLRFRRKSLKVFLAVKEEEYKKIKETLNLDEETPLTLKLNGEDVLTQLFKFIDSWMEENEIPLIENYEQQNFTKEDLQVGQLIKLGLIRVSVKKVTLKR